MRAGLDLRLNLITTITDVDAPPEKDYAEQAVERENEEVLDALGNAIRFSDPCTKCMSKPNFHQNDKPSLNLCFQTMFFPRRDCLNVN